MDKGRPEWDDPLVTRASPLARQLAAYVDYPEVLWQAHWEGVVMIGLRTSKGNRITAVRVYAQDVRLRRHLVRRLRGKRLDGVRPEGKEQLVKLYFRLH